MMEDPLTRSMIYGDNDPLDAVEISGITYEVGQVVPCVIIGVIGLID